MYKLYGYLLCYYECNYATMRFHISSNEHVPTYKLTYCWCLSVHPCSSSMISQKLFSITVYRHDLKHRWLTKLELPLNGAVILCVMFPISYKNMMIEKGGNSFKIPVCFNLASQCKKKLLNVCVCRILR